MYVPLVPKYSLRFTIIIYDPGRLFREIYKVYIPLCHILRQTFLKVDEDGGSSSFFLVEIDR